MNKHTDTQGRCEALEARAYLVRVCGESEEALASDCRAAGDEQGSSEHLQAVEGLRATVVALRIELQELRLAYFRRTHNETGVREASDALAELRVCLSGEPIDPRGELAAQGALRGFERTLSEWESPETFSVGADQ